MTNELPAPIRVAIVDDEALARSVLREYLAALPDVEVVAECANGFEAVKVVAELQPDLLLLDVQMPKLDGFEVLDLVGRDVAVIFVTAYDQYALKAFEVHAVDYLLKPFSATAAEVFARPRALDRRNGCRSEVSKAARPANTHASRVLVRDGSRVLTSLSRKSPTCRPRTITRRFFVTGKEHLKEQTLTDVESSLDPAKFVRTIDRTAQS
jgi:two-component system LytT family response regulator